MKCLSFIIALAALALGSQAQPVLERSYTESASITTLENVGDLYYAMDVVSKQCHLYLMDHSLYRTISLPVPEGYYLEDIQHVSQNLFNGDELIELVYIYSKYNPTAESYYYTYESKLINENGTVLSTYPGAGFTSVVPTTSGEMKFMVYEYDFSVIPYRTYTHVYGLPGSSSRSAESMLTPGTGNPYPNPSGGEVTVPLSMGPELSSGTFLLFNMRGERVWEEPLKGRQTTVVVPGDRLASGTYLYQVVSGGIRSPSRQLVIH